MPLNPDQGYKELQRLVHKLEEDRAKASYQPFSRLPLKLMVRILLTEIWRRKIKTLFLRKPHD